METQAQQDWHRADVKAALEKAGLSLAALARANGYKNPNSLCMVFNAPWPKAERIVAAAIGKHPAEIWPTRYGPDREPNRPSGRAKPGENRFRRSSAQRVHL